ncbi:MAG: iron-containing alcohol dehydrogenase, partial [Pseudomonadota bacterium]
IQVSDPNAHLPPCVEQNCNCGDFVSQAGLRDAFGLGFGADLPGAIEKLNRGLGLPKNLREMGVPEDCLDRMVDGALADHSNAGNPRKVERADYQALFKAAYG